MQLTSLRCPLRQAAQAQPASSSASENSQRNARNTNLVIIHHLNFLISLGRLFSLAPNTFVGATHISFVRQAMEAERERKRARGEKTLSYLTPISDLLVETACLCERRKRNFAIINSYIAGNEYERSGERETWNKLVRWFPSASKLAQDANEGVRLLCYFVTISLSRARSPFAERL